MTVTCREGIQGDLSSRPESNLGRGGKLNQSNGLLSVWRVGLADIGLPGRYGLLLEAGK